MGHDVFISYNSRMKNVADKIVATLESNGVKCWYAPRDVFGDYATSICEALEHTKVFVVLLDNTGSKSPHVLNEVEIAYKRIIEDDAELTILPFKLDKEELSKAMQYYIHRMHWIDASNDNINEAIEELLQKINTILKPFKAAPVNERTANTMYEHASELELRRLQNQMRFLRQFDGSVYKDAAQEFEQLNVLDIGTNDGTYATQTFDEVGKPYTLLGLDFNESIIEKAKVQYGNDKRTFQHMNVESDGLEDCLNDYLINNHLPGFNIINISMVLLHLSNPEKLLKRLRKFIVRGGYLIIKDLDDNFDVAYPDMNGYFDKIKELSIADSKLGGYRLTGRQIPYMLHKSGYRDIRLVKQGLTTLGMDYDKREQFFDFRFCYLKEDYKSLAEESSKNHYAQEGLRWLEEHYEDAKDEFLEEELFFNFGIMLFTARR